jgi:Ca2+:H+ antiporter
MSASIGLQTRQPVERQMVDELEEPELHIFVAVFTLAASTGLIALCSEYMVRNRLASDLIGGLTSGLSRLTLLVRLQARGAYRTPS